MGPKAHNILRFNGAYQDISGKAQIEVLPPQPGSIGNRVDLSPLYRNQVANVHREVRLNDDRTVLLEDTWTSGDTPVDVTWQWLTRASVTPTSTGFLLQQDGKSLTLTVEPLQGVTLSVEDVSAARAMQDSPNPGLSRIVIKQNTPAKTTARLRIKATPGSVQGKQK